METRPFYLVLLLASSLLLSERAHAQDEHEPEPQSYPSKANRGVKTGMLLVILFVALISGTAPQHLKSGFARRRDNAIPEEIEKRECLEEIDIITPLLEFVEIFSGGIALGVALLNSIPESVKLLAHAPKDTWREFPFAWTMAMLGFLITVGTERAIVPSLRSRMSTNQNPNKDSSVHVPLYREETSLLRQSAELEPGQNTSYFSWANAGIVIATFAGLGCHAFFIGLSMGLGGVRNAVLLFVAIITHTPPTAFRLGLQLSRGSVHTGLQVLVLGTWSLEAPLGIAIGSVVHGTVNGSVCGILHALVAGMLLAIAATGTSSVSASPTRKAHCFLAFLGGAASTIAVMAAWAASGVYGGNRLHD